MRDEDFTRYDRIRFSEVGDRFDPFSIESKNHVKNSYIVGDNINFLNTSFSDRGALAKRSNASLGYF